MQQQKTSHWLIAFRVIFTAALLAWADENGVDVNMTRESMTPHFMLDGIEYRAVRYSSHVRNIPILRVRCEV